MKYLLAAVVLLLLVPVAGCFPSGAEPVADPEQSGPREEVAEEGGEEEDPAGGLIAIPFADATVSGLRLLDEETLFVYRTWEPTRFKGFYLYHIPSGEYPWEYELDGEMVSASFTENYVELVSPDAAWRLDLADLQVDEEWETLLEDYLYQRIYTRDMDWFFVAPGLTAVHWEDNQAISHGYHGDFRRSSLHGLIRPDTVVYRTTDGEDEAGSEFFCGVVSADGSVDIQYPIHEVVSDVRGGRAIFTVPPAPEDYPREAFSSAIYTVDSSDYLLTETEIPNQGIFCLSNDGNIIGNMVLHNGGLDGITCTSYRFEDGTVIASAHIPVDFGVLPLLSVSSGGKTFAFAGEREEGEEISNLYLYTVVEESPGADPGDGALN